MTVRAAIGLGVVTLTALAACAGDNEAPASVATTATPASDAVSWDSIERILSARQGEYAVRMTGIASDGSEFTVSDETTRFDLDAPFVELTIHGAADPMSVIYTDTASFMRSDLWAAACGTPWVDMTDIHLERSAVERAASLQSEPALLAATVMGEPRQVSSTDGVTTYEVRVPGAFGLPPFPELPEVLATLSEGERTATLTAPADGSAVEIELVVDLSAVDQHLGDVEPDSDLTVHWTLASELDPIVTDLPLDAADPACADSSE